MTEASGVQRYGKTSGLTFRPPLPNPLVQRCLSALLPFLYQKALNGLQVSVDEVSLERLKAIQGERCLLLPNHPSQWDPWSMAGLARQLDEFFYYLAAREVFDWHDGKQGWLLQRYGCYSVVRGASDKDSFKTTKDILAQNRGRLVIFVEGEISNQNDSLLPLEPGVVQLAFLALQDLYKQNGKNLDKLPSLYLVPVALKYLYDPEHLDTTIDAALDRLEEATGLSAEGKTCFQRIRDIGFQVLEETARQFGCPLNPEDGLDDRIRSLEDFMLTKLEQVVNLPLDASLSYLDRVRRIRNTVDRVLHDLPETLTPYQHRLHDHQKDVLSNFYWDLDRIVNFIAIYDGYIQPEMIAERYVEVIRRLEKEVFGTPRLVHPRTCVISVLEPVDLKSHFDGFLQDKKKTAEQLIRRIETELFQAITTASLAGREDTRQKLPC